MPFHLLVYPYQTFLIGTASFRMCPLVAMTMKTKTCKPSSRLSRAGRRCQQSSFVGRCSENWRASFGLACPTAVQRLRRCLRVYYKNCLYRCRMMQGMACSSIKQNMQPEWWDIRPKVCTSFTLSSKIGTDYGLKQVMPTPYQPALSQVWGSRKILPNSLEVQGFQMRLSQGHFLV